MCRHVATTLAVFAVVTQVVLGAATPLGMVFCVGESHAGIELGSDDCCTLHAGAEHGAPASIERACCSDVPLHAEASLTDAQRTSGASANFALAGAVGSAIVPAPCGSAVYAVEPLPVAEFTRRSVALRV